MIIDPFALAKNNEKITGVLLQAFCVGIADYKLSDDTEISYDLSFGCDSAMRTVITGVASTKLKLLCGLCANHFIMPKTVELVLYPVKSEASAVGYPSELEIILINNNNLSLMEIIEEEIILSLPVMIKHPKGSAECYNKVDFGSTLKVEHDENNAVLYVTTNAKQENEFSKLKGLL